MKTNYDAMMKHLTDHTEPLSRLQKFEYAQCTEAHCRNGLTKFPHKRHTLYGISNKTVNLAFIINHLLEFLDGPNDRPKERTEHMNGQADGLRTNRRTDG